MKHKTITIDQLLNKGIEKEVLYTVESKPSLSTRFSKGITNDLSYKNTLNKCADEQYIRFIRVDGYSKLMEMKHPKEINKTVASKVERLINDNKVGYLDDDSFGCYLACRKVDYADLCKYLMVDYDERDDDKEFYYNSLFDDIKVWFTDYCELTNNVTDKLLYNVIRYICCNIGRYVPILLSAREWDEESSNNGTFWIDRLWVEAHNDYKNDKKGYVAW